MMPPMNFNDFLALIFVGLVLTYLTYQVIAGIFRILPK